MGKKYELLMDEEAVTMWERPMDYEHHKIYRIRALKDFADVKEGDLGGYVSSENCLSQEGDCWIERNCKVYDNSVVSGNARVKGTSELSGACIVSNNAVVDGMVIAHHCKFDWHSVVSGKLMLKSCIATGEGRITGDGCGIHIRADGATLVKVSGFGYKSETSAPKATS